LLVYGALVAAASLLVLVAVLAPAARVEIREVERSSHAIPGSALPAATQKRLRAAPGAAGVAPIPRRDPSPPPAWAPLQAALLRWLVLAAVAGMVVTVPLGMLLARRTTRPLEELTDAVRELRTGQLSRRVAVSGADEIAELCSAFNAMALDLERAEEARRRMVADIAHELRTPLSRMRVQLEAIEDGLQAPDRDSLASLQKDVLLLSRLVADLQDLALADADRLRLLMVELDVAAGLAHAAASHEAAARRKGVALQVACDPGLRLHADPDRLEQILGNLIDNALAWTPSGGTVMLTAARAGEAIELVVADDGAGIASEHLPRLFDRFYRADPARGRGGRGGAGIGLAVVQALVRAHGGDVGVSSEPGQGARFVVRLPLSGPSLQVANNPFVRCS
jgi:two-component system sensor histidine kinase BaeS